MGRTFLASGLAAAAILTGAFSASADTFITLHKFCRDGFCNDGMSPLEAPLIPDGRGNYLGTAENGGANGSGVLYELVGGEKFKKLFDFPTSGAPLGSLIQDTQGNLYGVVGGGSTNHGAVFRLRPLNTKRTQWAYDVLYDFCPQSNSCPDGDRPLALTYEGAGSGVPYDGQAPLYGTTDFGGDKGYGTVFALTDNGGAWSEKVIYSICSRKGCTDGKYGGFALVDGPDGALYGVTANGGDEKSGVVYKLTPNAKRTKWTQSVVYSFCALADCTDGRDPFGLTLDGEGGLYGVTQGGGDVGVGTLFQISPQGSFTRLHSFCLQLNCPDGAPSSSPIVAPDGTLYGTTSTGLWSFAPQTSTYSLLHAFCSDGKCKDGFEVNSPLALTADGTLLGTTFDGGNQHDGGTVFSYMP